MTPQRGTRAGRFPWGAGPAPAHNCHACGRRIGKQQLHCVVHNSHVLCSRCIDQRHLHTRYYPDCPITWHDMLDHGPQLADRAAAWFVLSGQLDEKLATHNVGGRTIWEGLA